MLNQDRREVMLAAVWAGFVLLVGLELPQPRVSRGSLPADIVEQEDVVVLFC